MDKRNLKQIITTECTKTAIFQLLWPLDISKLVERERERERERAYTIIYYKMDSFLSKAITLAIIWLEIVKKRYKSGA